MNKRALWAGFLALAITAALLLFKSQLNHSDYERFEKDLRQIKQTDTFFCEEVLKARFSMVSDYDEFLSYEKTLQESADRLKNIPDFVDAAGKSAIFSLGTEYQALLKKRLDMFEEFKSQNAVLNNSLNYFPEAAEELIGSIAHQGNEQLEASLNALLRTVLVYGANPDEGMAGIQTCSDQLKSWSAQHPGHAAAPLIANLLLHANTIAVRKPVVDRLIRDIVSLPGDEKIEQMFQIYETSLSRALSHSNFYRAFFYILGSAILIGAIYIFLTLRANNRNLEKRVNERTVELHQANEGLRTEMMEKQQAQSALLQTSRLAGMAEVATSVLHNVGNALNSVNVSSTVVTDKVRKSKVTSLGKAVELMQANSGRLADFFANDPKGLKLPSYLGQLSHQLVEEQSNILEELSSLSKNLEHIKEIVAMQQNYARVSGVSETLSAVELIEDALRLNAGALERHHVRVVRDYKEAASVNVEKHKVLQILVNLIHNAKYAVDSKQNADRQITLRVNGDDAKQVKISVIDNGVGIPGENLTRIFNYGFTTKKEGHGFGLHSGALAAKELGGSLTVHSDGPGHGAMFTLALPC